MLARSPTPPQNLSRPSTASSAPPLALFVALWASAAVPLVFQYVPTLDGPVHLAITQILNDRGDPALPRLNAFFDVDLSPEPNWLIYIILLAVTKLVPVGSGEKAVVALHLLSLPASMLLFVRHHIPDPAARRAALLLAPCVFAFMYNAAFYFGFYNFNLSVALFVASTSMCLCHLKCPGPGRAVAVVAATFLLFFTHVMDYAVSMLVAGSCVLWAGLLALCSTRPRGGLGRFAPASRVVAAGAAPLMPSVALLGYFLWRNHGATLSSATTEGGLADRLRWLAFLSVLSGHSLLELPLLAVLLGVPATVGVVALRRRIAATGPEVEDGLLLGAVAVLAAALVLPNALFGGGYTAVRVQVFVSLVPLPWVVRNAHHARVRRPVPAVLASAAAALLLLVQVWQVRAMSEQFARVVRAGSHVEADRTILPVVLAERGADGGGEPLCRGIGFLLHAYARITAERHAIALRVHQAQTLNFPVRYAAGSDPYRHLPAVHALLGDDLRRPEVLADLPRQIDRGLRGLDRADHRLHPRDRHGGVALALGASAAAEALGRRLAGGYEPVLTDPVAPGVVLLRHLQGAR